jgi:hypothetical protein
MALPDVADAWDCPVHMHTDDLAVWPHELNYLETHGHFDAGTARNFSDVAVPWHPPHSQTFGTAPHLR